MTEQEFMTTQDPAALLRHFSLTSTVAHHQMPSERKLRLFAAECFFATHGQRLGTSSHWQSFEEGLQGDFPTPPLTEAMAWATGARYTPGRPRMADLLREVVGNPWRAVTHPASGLDPSWLTSTVLEMARHAYGYRDFTGLPYVADALEEAGCPAEVECGDCPVLRKAKVTAEGAYDRDMVQEVIAWGQARKACRCQGTGRVPHPLLAHLRGPNTHVRGCWALDIILGYT